MAFPIGVSTSCGVPRVVMGVPPMVVRLSKRQEIDCWAKAGIVNARRAAARSFMCTPAYGNDGWKRRALLFRSVALRQPPKRKILGRFMQIGAWGKFFELKVID